MVNIESNLEVITNSSESESESEPESEPDNKLANVPGPSASQLAAQTLPSVRVEKSSDVHVGPKLQYHGPVTVKNYITVNGTDEISYNNTDGSPHLQNLALTGVQQPQRKQQNKGYRSSTRAENASGWQENTSGWQQENTSWQQENTTGWQENTSQRQENTTGWQENTSQRQENTTGWQENTSRQQENTSGLQNIGGWQNTNRRQENTEWQNTGDWQNTNRRQENTEWQKNTSGWQNNGYQQSVDFTRESEALVRPPEELGSCKTFKKLFVGAISLIVFVMFAVVFYQIFKHISGEDFFKNNPFPNSDNIKRDDGWNVKAVLGSDGKIHVSSND